MEPLIGVVVGSQSDLSRVEDCTQMLDKLEVPYKVVIASAHRSPAFLRQAIAELDPQVEAYIAFAGMAAHLPGVVASQTVKPVIGVPVSVSLAGLDALLSIVQMPPGVPVGAMAIDGSKNAAIFAASILAASERGKELRLAEKLTQMRANLAAGIEGGAVSDASTV
ncbi:MAG: 5-(carboxyamino)imidazole ribonucleotide mutase [Candidatus Riflebacteria bacterium RBG_13_59_9]|nr:MAG: 5-(carboxyamino)imidazole ribonucleotide mutase [Candidatus Riflebacteria bacterium RBG_13_59_9]